MTASTSLTVLVTCSAAFIFLVWASAWLWGRIWFAITMASLAGVLVASEFVGIGAQSEVKRLFSLSGLALFFVMAFYFLGSRYITRTRLSDLTYQSHEALVRYIDDNQLSSPFARLMRRMGPVLLTLALIYAGFAAWAMFTGRLE